MRIQQLDGKTGICFTCLKDLHHCGSCNKPILDTYFKYEFSDQHFCRECHDTRPHCYTCGLPVGNRFWRFPDSREICDECNKRAVIDVKKVRQIMAEVEKLIPRYVGIKAENPYELHVEAMNNQSQVSSTPESGGEGEPKASPLFGGELGLFRMKGGKSEIFLLYGLPVEMIYETAAHEYAHAWQSENCSPNQSEELREGFAQWVAAQILQVKGYKLAYEKLEARRDNPYGTGYHKIKSIHDRYGKKRMLEYVTTTAR